MARRTLIWHLGLPDAARAVVPSNLQAHRGVLAEAGVQVVATAEEASLATHELRRTHRRAGLSRAEVEGRWARLCNRIWDHKGVSVLSTPDLCAADKDELRLALDPLIGVEVHLVVTLEPFSEQLYGGWAAELRAGRTTGWDTWCERVLAGAEGPREHRQAEEFWSGHDLVQVLARWGWTFHADRLHVLAPGSAEDQWRSFLSVVGIEAGPAAVSPSYADPAGVALLRKVNRQVDDRVAGVEHLLTPEVLPLGEERAAMPVVATPGLEPLVARWDAELRRAGHDVRGDLDALLARGPEAGLPGRRDQLATAVDALSSTLAENHRLRARVGDLEADRARLDRKRRKLKRRLKALTSA